MPEHLVAQISWCLLQLNQTAELHQVYLLLCISLVHNLLLGRSDEALAIYTSQNAPSENDLQCSESVTRKGSNHFNSLTANFSRWSMTTFASGFIRWPNFITSLRETECGNSNTVAFFATKFVIGFHALQSGFFL